MTGTLELATLGWDAQWALETAAHPASEDGCQPGRVTRVERSHVRVMLEDRQLTIPGVGLAVGDWVLTDGETITAQLDRRTLLARKEPGRSSEEQVLAANIDVVVIVEPMYPQPSTGRIERMATLAWSSGATPLVVLTKSDLAEPGSNDQADVQLAAFGVEVLTVSAETGDGLEQIRERISSGMTFVLLGPSGAGKSTLVNALAGDEMHTDHEALATGAVRGDGRGKHTTTHRELVVLPGLGCLIDTPGIREVGLVADDEGIDRAFEDITSFARECKFADCAHDTEPRCAVQQAIADGLLAPTRLDSYRRLLREIAHQTSRKSAQDRSALRALGKQRARAVKEINRVKGKRDH